MCGSGNVRGHKRVLAPKAPSLVFQVRKFLVGVPSFWDVFSGHALVEILSFLRIFHMNCVPSFGMFVVGVPLWKFCLLDGFSL